MGDKSLDKGHRSIKMRLGKSLLAEDIARVSAMREHLPEDIELMADANEAWRVDQAANALEALQPLGYWWKNLSHQTITLVSPI